MENELEIEILTLLQDDYATLESITRSGWSGSVPMPPDEVLVRVLRELQSRELVQAHRYTPQEYVPLDEFQDEAVDEISWTITEAGRAALEQHFEDQGSRDE